MNLESEYKKWMLVYDHELSDLFLSWQNFAKTSIFFQTDNKGPNTVPVIKMWDFGIVGKNAGFFKEC